ncbi:MAG: hypothetical protein LBN34_03055 [Clostridiales Family XIII bacterium]|nr:hypothetical protein [Clostridiales Family XIII bacterium]
MGKSKPKANTVYCPVRIPDSMDTQLKMLAAKRHTTSSALIREFIEAGLRNEPDEGEVDLIAKVVRQEMKVQLDKQIDRLAKMNMKIGKISGGGYYLLLRMLLSHGLTNASTVAELATESRKMGVRFMQMKDSEVNEYLEDEDQALFDAQKL